MLHVVANLKVQSGQEEEIKKTFLKVLPEVEKEAGTLEYRLLQSQNNPLEFTVYEKYTDVDAFMTHGAAPYLSELIGAWIPILDGELEVITFDEIAGKG
jgi:quinol monooxygenase YgiN